MANWLKSKETDQFDISIPRFRIEEYYADYEISVKCSQNMEWRVYKRYSDFKRLKDELTKNDSTYKTAFPPKKSFNNMSSSFLNERRLLLEKYLNYIVSQCHQCIPRPFSLFLQMDKYEIHGITTALAKYFFFHGNTLINSNKTFDISVLFIHSINKRMLSPAPTNQYQKKNEDFGNVLEVVGSLKKVKVVPNVLSLNSTDNCYGASNIKVTDLTFDLSIFTSVTHLELNSVEIANLRGLFRMNNTIETLSVHFCLKSIEDLLFVYRESSVDHLQSLDGPLRCTTDVDLSHNSVTDIDVSIVTLVQVQRLNLSHNQLSDVHFLHHLTFLTELDLSHNNLYQLQTLSLSNKLGNVTKLSLKANKLTSLSIVDRMFSLQQLDVSNNRLSDRVSLLSLCRLSCLVSLHIEDNPVCSRADFMAVLYDLFLDRYRLVTLNGLHFADVPAHVRPCVDTFRARMRLALVASDCETELSSVDIRDDEFKLDGLHDDTVLACSRLYNVLVYWFFVATGRCVCPQKLLWVTEVFAASGSRRPEHVLLVTGDTQSTHMLKLRLVPASEGPLVTVRPRDFVDLSDDFRHLVIGADRSFLRFDRTADCRDLFLCHESSSLDAFLYGLFHEDDGTAVFGYARIVTLNGEDRVAMLQHFVDVWRLDVMVSLKRTCDQVNIRMDEKSVLLFISRAMLQMRNGFQLLLTVVVTGDLIFLVDERINDWPSFSRQPNLSDKSSGNSCSPYISSCGQFPFLRTNAYFLRHVNRCTEMAVVGNYSGLVHRLCPSFRCPVEITFVAVNQVAVDPLKLIFESATKTHQLCRLINEQRDHSHPLSSVADDPRKTSKPSAADVPCHLRHLSSSYSEIRSSLSLSCPQLSSLAQLCPQDVLSQYCSIIPRSRDAKIYGMLWTKFIYCDFDSDKRTAENGEHVGLVSFTSDGVYVLHEPEKAEEKEEEEEDDDTEVQCPSDTESEQADKHASMLVTIFVARESVFRLYVGLNSQWVTVSSRGHGDTSESARLVLLARSRHLSKCMVGWLEEMSSEKLLGHRGNEEKSSVTVEYGHQDGAVEQLVCQIRQWSPCGNIEFVLYCSLEDVRFEPPMSSHSSDNSGNGMFSHAAVVTTENISIIKHNVGEYPARQLASGAIEQPAAHSQYRIVAVVALANCLQLRLPGYDRAVLIIVTRVSTSLSIGTLDIHVSLSCQKEQRRLIDTLRHQRSQCLHAESPLLVSVC